MCLKKAVLSISPILKDSDVIFIGAKLTDDGKLIKFFYYRTASTRTRVWEKLEEHIGRPRKQLYKEGVRVVKVRLVPI